MRAHFSIEWMAQSSQAAGSWTLQAPQTLRTPQAPQTLQTTPPGPAASHSESLPGFYRKCPTEPAPAVQDGFGLQSRTKNQACDVSSSSGVDSDYESEGRRSLSPPGDPPAGAPGSPQGGRRSRTAFTAEQISCLEKSFKRNAYLGTQDKAELCRKLHLSDKQVRNWFQNRRMKMKRTMQDALAQACQATTTSQLLLYSDLQACRARAHHRYPAVAPEGPAAPYGPQQALQFGPGLAVDSSHQYGGFVLPAAAAATAHYRTPYPNYPQYY